MKGLRILACAVALTVLSSPLLSQPASPTTGYHYVQCFKTKPDKGLEFRKWAEGDLHKYVQALVDSGRLSSWALIRAVTPAGSASLCDYFMVAFYPGLPPEPISMADLGAALKKAGLSMTPGRVGWPPRLSEHAGLDWTVAELPGSGLDAERGLHRFERSESDGC